MYEPRVFDLCPGGRDRFSCPHPRNVGRLAFPSRHGAALGGTCELAKPVITFFFYLCHPSVGTGCPAANGAVSRDIRHAADACVASLLEEVREGAHRSKYAMMQPGRSSVPERSSWFLLGGFFQPSLPRRHM